jgi:hypothetical protein
MLTLERHFYPHMKYVQYVVCYCWNQTEKSKETANSKLIRDWVPRRQTSHFVFGKRVLWESDDMMAVRLWLWWRANAVIPPRHHRTSHFLRDEYVHAR